MAKISDKTKKFSASFPESLKSFAERRADKAHGGNLSLYLQSLVAKDRAAKTESDQEDALLALVRTYDPTLEEAFKESLDDAGAKDESKVDQRVVIRRLLDALFTAMKRGIDPQWPFEITSKDQAAYFQDELADLAVAEDASKKRATISGRSGKGRIIPPPQESNGGTATGA